MDSLQILTIKSIIDGISDNEQISSLMECLDKKCRENINAKYREHYWSHEDDKFNDRLAMSQFSLYNGILNIEELGIRYRVNQKLEGDPLYIRDLELDKSWKFKGTWDNFTVKGYYDNPDRGEVGEVPQDVLNYALFLWKHKP